MADGVLERDAAAPRPAVPGDPEPVDGLIVPAFADWHVHWVQLGIRRADRSDLLKWLVRTTWPAELAFMDAETCRQHVPDAVASMVKSGTAAGAVWGSPSAASADAFLQAAPESFLCGPAVMTRNGPPELLSTPEAAVAGLEALIAKHGDRAVVTPRFALSCDQETLAELGALALRSGGWVQTHLSENEDEVSEVARLFPESKDYLDVYERRGLVGPRTLLAHAVHVSDDELARIAARRAIVVHCPTSNRALGSGTMPLERVRAAGVKWVLGSDVGAGPHLNMLDAIACAMDVHPAGSITHVELFHRATLGLRALAGGHIEERAPTIGHRAGALVVPMPAGVDPGTDDAEAVFGALVDRWRQAVA